MPGLRGGSRPRRGTRARPTPSATAAGGIGGRARRGLGERQSGGRAARCSPRCGTTSGRRAASPAARRRAGSTRRLGPGRDQRRRRARRARGLRAPDRRPGAALVLTASTAPPRWGSQYASSACREAAARPASRSISAMPMAACSHVPQPTTGAGPRRARRAGRGRGRRRSRRSAPGAPAGRRSSPPSPTAAPSRSSGKTSGSYQSLTARTDRPDGRPGTARRRPGSAGVLGLLESVALVGEHHVGVRDVALASWRPRSAPTRPA